MLVRTESFSKTQMAMAARIGGLPADEQPKELLKWALGRITHYGPTNEPAAVVIREYLDNGRVDKNNYIS